MWTFSSKIDGILLTQSYLNPLHSSSVRVSISFVNLSITSSFFTTTEPDPTFSSTTTTVVVVIIVSPYFISVTGWVTRLIKSHLFHTSSVIKMLKWLYLWLHVVLIDWTRSSVFDVYHLTLYLGPSDWGLCRELVREWCMIYHHHLFQSNWRLSKFSILMSYV